MKLCLIGPSAAGKTTIAQYLHEKHEFRYVEASDYVRARFAQGPRTEPLIDYVDREFREKGKETFSKDVLADPVVRGVGAGHLVISGFRAFEEYIAAQAVFSDLQVAGIYANSATRYARWLKREGKGSTDFSYPKFVLKDMREYQFGIARLMAEAADVMYFNDGSIDDLRRWCDAELVR